MGYSSEAEFGSLRLRPPDVEGVAYRVRKRAPSYLGGLESQRFSRQVAAACEYDFSTFPESWQGLGEELRSELLQSTQVDRGWQKIVVHASGFAADEPRYLTAWQKAVSGIEGERVYHFLIGKHRDDTGQVQFSGRWRQMVEQNIRDRELHVCLIGDFDYSVPPASQLRALHELVVFLRARVGEIPVTLHDGDGGCLGRLFPVAAIDGGINGKPSAIPAGDVGGVVMQ
jgi:hypothetical protein